jgi:hypothetical protein
MKQLNLWLCLICTIICGAQTKPVIKHLKTSTFDVAIFPAEYFDDVNKHFTPSKEDIIRAENALRTDLAELNKDLTGQDKTPIIHKNLSRYFRQYSGYINDSGQHILLINNLWKSDNSSNEWRKQIIDVADGGSYYWNVKYNCSTGELFYLVINFEA